VGEYTLRIHYAEHRPEGPGFCGCRDGEGDWVTERVVFTVERGCDALEPECPPLPEKCVSLTEYVCGRLGAGTDIEPAELKGLCEDPGELHPAGCDDVSYDPCSGIALACVSIVEVTNWKKECGSRFAFGPDTPKVCAYRPYVYRNPLLFELIRGCHVDLARVKTVRPNEWINLPWDAPLPWLAFDTAIKRGPQVWFTKPILKQTLDPRSVFMTAIVREQDSSFRDVLRIPADIVPLQEDGRDAVLNEHAAGIRFKVSQDWLRMQIESELSRFDFGATIELTIRGALLRDKCGNVLDGRPLTSPPERHGIAMPGDDFVVAFRVQRRPHRSRD
jgi:hypothetical protein